MRRQTYTTHTHTYTLITCGDDQTPIAADAYIGPFLWPTFSHNVYAQTDLMLWMTY